MSRSASWLGLVLLLAGRPALANEEPKPPSPAPPPPPWPVAADAGGVAVPPLSDLSPSSSMQLPPTPPSARYESRWYGGQIMIPDAVGIALVAAGLGARTNSTSSAALGVSAVAILTLDGPITHIVHGRYGAAGESFALRAGGGIVGALIGGLTTFGGQNRNADVSPALVGGVFGYGIGAMLVMIGDDVGLGWENVLVAPPRTSMLEKLHLSLAPMAGPRQGGVGVVGTF